MKRIFLTIALSVMATNAKNLTNTLGLVASTLSYP